MSAGSSVAAGGGGGGSSYVFSFATSVARIGGSGASAGNAASSDYVSGTGTGSAGTTGSTFAANGGNGEVFLRYTVAVTSSAAPEPSALVLLFTGMLPLAGMITRRGQRNAA